MRERQTERQTDRDRVRERVRERRREREREREREHGAVASVSFRNAPDWHTLLGEVTALYFSLRQ